MLGGLGGGGGGPTSKEFGSSTASTTFGNFTRNGAAGADSWLPAVIFGGVGLLLLFILTLRK